MVGSVAPQRQCDASEVEYATTPDSVTLQSCQFLTNYSKINQITVSTSF